MKVLTALACIRSKLQANNSLFTKNLIAYSSHVMQAISMGLCMHVDL